MARRLAAAGHLNIVTSCREALTNISSRNLSTVRVFLSIQPPYILPFWGQFYRLIEKMFSISLPSKAPHSPSLHSGKVRGVTYCLTFMLTVHYVNYGPAARLSRENWCVWTTPAGLAVAPAGPSQAPTTTLSGGSPHSSSYVSQHSHFWIVLTWEGDGRRLKLYPTCLGVCWHTNTCHLPPCHYLLLFSNSKVK